MAPDTSNALLREVLSQPLIRYYIFTVRWVVIRVYGYTPVSRKHHEGRPVSFELTTVRVMADGWPD